MSVFIKIVLAIIAVYVMTKLIKAWQRSSVRRAINKGEDGFFVGCGVYIQD